MPRGEDPSALQQEQAARVDAKDPAHVIAAKVAHVLGKELHPEQPHPAGVAVHYALGVLPGMLYAPVRDQLKMSGAGRGLLYGLTLFVVNDELLNPILGLSGGPSEYPWQAHARGLAGHLVLGTATEAALDVLDHLA